MGRHVFILKKVRSVFSLWLTHVSHRWVCNAYITTWVVILEERQRLVVALPIRQVLSWRTAPSLWNAALPLRSCVYVHLRLLAESPTETISLIVPSHCTNEIECSNFVWCRNLSELVFNCNQTPYSRNRGRGPTSKGKGGKGLRKGRGKRNRREG